MIEPLLEALELKALDRAGWVRVGLPRPESVAAHSWGVAWLVLVLLPAGLDRSRALAYAILHDLPEVRTGDLTPADGVGRAEKARREHSAMRAFTAGLPPHLLALWLDYEAQGDPEARFVRQCDRLDMALQAVAYQRTTPGRALSGSRPRWETEFLDAAATVIEDAPLVALLDRLREEVAGR